MLTRPPKMPSGYRGRLAATAFAIAVTLVARGANAADYDLVIRHGRVLDGAGNPWISADVAIKDGRIVRIGDIAGRGTREIDASGDYVSPGFIDMLDHSDEVLLKNGAAENKLHMGVTTIIAGEATPPVAPSEIPAYFSQLERQGIAVNFATYYATIQARVKIMGDKAGAPTPEQLRLMEKEVDTAMHNGAVGITTALIYSPQSFQSTDDLIDLAKVASKCGGIYSTHVRDEGASIIPAINEAIEIGEKGGLRVEIFHLKASYAPGWGKLMPQIIETISAARARGVDVAADMYPYTAGGTGLDITVPTWVWADGIQKGIERLRDPAIRTKLKIQVAAGSTPDWSNLVEASGGWDHVMLANAFNPQFDEFRGQSIAAIGKALHRDPADVAWDILLAALPNRAVALYFHTNELDMQMALKQPWTSIGTDAAATLKFGDIDGIGLPHPRSYGTFPRVLAEYVKRQHVLTLEDAVRKMTSWPAERMGFSDRGLIRVGMRADISIFDLGKIDDVSSWTNPTGVPTGIDTVIVNGAVALDHGKYTGSLSGNVLRHQCALSPMSR